MAQKKKLRPKYIMRRMLLLLLLLALLAGGGWYLVQGGFFGAILGGPEEEGTSSASESVEPSQNDNQEDEDAAAASSASQSEDEEERILPQSTTDDNWNLLLVNSDNPLPADFDVELETIYDGYRVDVRIAEAALAMFTQAKLDGITIFPCSAYRPVDYQQGLFDNKVQEYLAQGVDEEEAIATTATIIAVPGTSEHHTGLAMDIVTTEYQVLDEGFAETPAFRWLDQNAHKYGFVLRYPANKQEITGIIYEPWHYRYVGEDHAAVMKEYGLCLEEYVTLYQNQLTRIADSQEDADAEGEDSAETEQ